MSVNEEQTVASQANLIAVFENCASSNADTSAVEFADCKLTYRELNERANQLAHFMMRLGVEQETRVGIFLERSVDAVMAVLAILKAGAAYVPLDPGYPRERLMFMLEDSGAALVVTRSELAERFPMGSGRAICLDMVGPTLSREIQTNPDCVVEPHNLAYLLYTSGSTGQPKGVAMEHRVLANLIAWQTRSRTFRSCARTIQFASLGFDVSFQEVFSTWCSGGTLVLVPEVVRRDPIALFRFISNESIERVFLPFVAFRQLAEVAQEINEPANNLREIITAGEQLRVTPAIARWLEQLDDCTLQNQYGPTETHVVTAHTLVGTEEPGTLPPIGKPIQNVQIHVLDDDLEPVADGESGEIFVAGIGLSRGYVNRPDLTTERFLANPFTDRPGDRIYRTGDLARRLPDGNLEFLGRVDNQVKVRGYRIELGEVESVLGLHPLVTDAVVTASHDASGDNRLVAYLVVRRDHRPSVSELRDFLGGKLPDYMLPSAFVLLNALPLTPTGKVDRLALPSPDETRPDLGAECIPPRTETERVLTEIWSRYLDSPEMGIYDDFLYLGGDSLKATRILFELKNVLGVELSHERFFAASTVSVLATEIDLAPRDRIHNGPPTQFRVQRHEAARALSFGQEEVWFSSQLNPGAPVYNEPFTVHLKPPVDSDALEQAFRALIARHDSLRSGFVAEDGQLIRNVFDDVRFNLHNVDLRPFARSEREARAGQLATEQARVKFDLSEPPLFRATLVRMGPAEHRLYLTMHHIVVDAFAVYHVLVPELWKYHDDFRKGQPVTLPPLHVTYSDYVSWQRDRRQEDLEGEQLRYWKGQLAGLTPLQLPSDRLRPPIRSGRGEFQPFTISREILQDLHTLSRRCGVTLFMTLLATFKTLLWRHTQQDDIAVGTVEAGRSRPEFEGLLGYCLNTLVLRTQLSGDFTFQDLLGQVRQTCLQAFSHREAPFTRLVQEMREHRDRTHHPLFQVAFVMEPQLPAHESGWTVSQFDVQTGTAKFDLTVELEERDERIIGRFQYDTDLFDAVTIQRLLGRFQRLLEWVAVHPDCPLAKLPLLGEAEREQMLSQWNSTRRDYPAETCIHERFADQAEKTPEAIALVSADQQMTYRELNRRANQLAHHLRSLGVGQESLVGICLERSVEMVVGLLGILKAGAAYVPLDPEYPQKRLAFMLADSGVPLLLTEQRMLSKLDEQPAQVFCFDRDGHLLDEHSDADPPDRTIAGQLAYINYTSGSTGKPKAVAVCHRGVMRLLFGVDYVRIDASSTTLHLSSICFDASTFELWAALLHGGRCVLFPNRIPTTRELGELIRNERVDTLWLTASLFNTVIEECPDDLNGVKQLLIGGEMLSPRHVQLALDRLPNTRLINGYGPTESTTFACCYEVPRDRAWEKVPSIPIGRPISNTQVFVLDRYREPVPVGVPGELYIGGAGLARGYINRPRLTAERFLDHPFSAEPGARVYKTGDICRWLPDGNLEFLGRQDDQVKVRGFRVELGEIEAALGHHCDVRQAVVLLREDKGEKRVVAFVVAGPSKPPTVGDLRAFLKNQLPEYMIPAFFVLLDALPLSPNGKVDRQALSLMSLESCHSPAAVAGPRNDLERELVEIWRKVLANDSIGVADNFFELGGHSLLGVRLAALIERRLHKRMPVDLLFQAPTIEQLAAWIRQQQTDEPPPLVVPLRSDGPRPPFFAVPPSLSPAIVYAPLARALGDEQPFYGLVPPTPDPTGMPSKWIETTAAQFIDEVRQIQPRGPYYLGGRCYGGFLAFEVAQQLIRSGDQVALLVMLDVGPPLVRKLNFYVSRLRYDVEMSIRNLRESVLGNDPIEYVVIPFHPIHYDIVPIQDRNEASDDALLWDAQLRASAKYVTQPYAGKVTFFASRQNHLKSVRDEWGKLARGEMDYHVIETSHQEMFVEPQVEILATKLRLDLDHAQQ